MSYAYRLLPGGYVDETGVHRGVPPTEDDWKRIVVNTMHRTLFCDLNQHPFVNKVVYSREDVQTMLRRGEISETRAEELLRISRGPHLLTARTGEQDYCGGPGVCEWCIKGIAPEGEEK